MRRVLKIAGVLGLIYALLVVGLFAVMCQPPEVFGRVMRHVPTVAYILLPFKPLWLHARAGHLKVGDVAPDFSLHTVDKKSRFHLSSLRGEKPVVLVFGSYT
ncbi:MAG: hypothetical protein HYS33_02695 [Acidobacteria bacterium]|nr:hypothetical protein [Acidobacteriota bacterium]